MAQFAAGPTGSDSRSHALHREVEAIRAEVGRVIVGQQGMIDRLLVALLTNNHALIEGVPGLAKTLAVSKSLRSSWIKNALLKSTFNEASSVPPTILALRWVGPRDEKTAQVYHSRFSVLPWRCSLASGQSYLCGRPIIATRMGCTHGVRGPP